MRRTQVELDKRLQLLPKLLLMKTLRAPRMQPRATELDPEQPGAVAQARLY